jgi:hypothetical protein
VAPAGGEVIRMLRAALVALVLGVAAPASAAAVDVPVNLGIGPAVYLISGPVYRDTPLHYGLKIELKAVLSKQFIESNLDKVPRQYRTLARGLQEVRVSPSILIPDALIISPKPLTIGKRTGMYGVTWRPVSLGVPVGGEAASFNLAAGLLLTSFFLHSDTLPTTFFLRPGIDLTAELHLQVVPKKFYVSLGWASGFYVPQVLGGFLSVTPIDQAVWHMGQGFVKLHFRCPYRVNL